MCGPDHARPSLTAIRTPRNLRPHCIHSESRILFTFGFRWNRTQVSMFALLGTDVSTCLSNRFAHSAGLLAFWWMCVRAWKMEWMPLVIRRERGSECEALLFSNFSSPVTMAKRLASRAMKRIAAPPKTKRQAMKRPAGRPKMARKVSIVVDRWWDWIGFWALGDVELGLHGSRWSKCAPKDVQSCSQSDALKLAGLVGSVGRVRFHLSPKQKHGPKLDCIIK